MAADNTKIPSKSFSDKDTGYSTNFDKGVIDSLKFPTDIGSAERPNYVVIYINEITDTKYSGALGVARRSGDNPVTVVGADSAVGTGIATALYGDFASAAKASLVAAVVKTAAKSYNRLRSVIALPMPTQFSVPQNMSWEGNDASVSALAAADLSDQLDAAAKNKFSQWVASAKTGASVNRQVINTAVEASFQSVTPRGFNFTWELYPKNIEEAKAIWDIIQIFKGFSLPQLGDGGASLISPATFDFEFHHKGVRNDWMPKSLSCACTNISVNYSSGQGFTGFDIDKTNGEHILALSRSRSLLNGSPSTSIVLDVSFQEVEVLTRDRIDKGNDFKFNLSEQYDPSKGIF